MVALLLSGRLTGHRELALTLQESRVGRYQMLATATKHTRYIAQAGGITYRQTCGPFVQQDTISIIPSSEIFRPPHACSHYLPDCCCDGKRSIIVGQHESRSGDWQRLGQRKNGRVSVGEAIHDEKRQILTSTSRTEIPPGILAAVWLELEGGGS